MENRYQNLTLSIKDTALVLAHVAVLANQSRVFSPNAKRLETLQMTFPDKWEKILGEINSLNHLSKRDISGWVMQFYATGAIHPDELFGMADALFCDPSKLVKFAGRNPDDAMPEMVEALTRP